jgi:hypothetical protein
MMTMTDLVGYIASMMVLLAFMTKEMRLLRVLAMLSNIAFISYGILDWLPPVFCLHAVLLPVSALRLRQESCRAPVRCSWAAAKIFGAPLKAGSRATS